MKARKLFKVVILTAVLFVSATSSMMNAQEKNFVTNEETVGNLVMSKTIYRLSEGTLYSHMKYDFTYDDQNRMISKVVYKWDSQNELWAPNFKMTYTYSEKEMTVEYARWNQKSKLYDLAMEKSVYELNKDNVPVAYFNYKWKDYYWAKESNHYWAQDSMKNEPMNLDLSSDNKRS